MRLAEFIHENVEPILAEWEVFAGSLAPGATMTRLALRDDAEWILLATVRDMQAAQSLSQQETKSKGHGGADCAESDGLDNASARHGEERVSAGFDIEEVVSEYRALRASVLRLWRKSLSQTDLDDIDDVTRFNESMDQSLAQAVRSYNDRVTRSRRIFLSILSHDLRNPLTCIRMATLMVSRRNKDAKSAEALSSIEQCAEVSLRLIKDLIDFTSTALGSEMPLTRAPVDLEKVCHEVVNGILVTHPDRTIRFDSDGDLNGEWDADRLRQVVSNLVCNALEHGSHQGPVDISVASEDSTVVLSVHNEGKPIPPDMLTTIFDPLVRYETEEQALERLPGSMGLGLYIVREIVLAKGGKIDVASTAEAGTTFTVRIPRRPA